MCADLVVRPILVNVRFPRGDKRRVSHRGGPKVLLVPGRRAPGLHDAHNSGGRTLTPACEGGAARTGIRRLEDGPMSGVRRIALVGAVLTALGVLASCSTLSLPGDTSKITFVSTTTTGGWKYDYYREHRVSRAASAATRPSSSAPRSGRPPPRPRRCGRSCTAAAPATSTRPATRCRVRARRSRRARPRSRRTSPTTACSPRCAPTPRASGRSRSRTAATTSTRAPTRPTRTTRTRPPTASRARRTACTR